MCFLILFCASKKVQKKSYQSKKEDQMCFLVLFAQAKSTEGIYVICVSMHLNHGRAAFVQKQKVHHKDES